MKTSDLGMVINIFNGLFHVFNAKGLKTAIKTVGNSAYEFVINI